MHAYDEMYLEDAMRNLGRMMEVGIADRGIPAEDFYAMFLACGIGDRFGEGHPRYVAGCSGEELAEMVIRRSTDARSGPGMTEKPGPGMTEKPGPGMTEKRAPGFGEAYWAGWALAYLQWESGCSFATLQGYGIDLETVLEQYGPLHEADVTKLSEVFLKRMEETSPLKRMRRNAGMTQEALAARAGVSVRMIRAYEQGSQDIRRAEAASVNALASALGCRVETIISGGRRRR